MSQNFANKETSRTGNLFRALFPSRTRTATRSSLESRAESTVRKVLVVDDDAIILKTLSIKLSAAGFEVQTASDGADAIRAMREDRPDLVVLDINFPPDVPHGGGVPWDGFVLMRWLRSMDRGRKVPVIFITGSYSVSYKEKALACGALGLFQKPIDHERLLLLIEVAMTGEAAAQLDTNFQI